MKKLRQWHLHLGCVFTPLLLLFSVTGALQMFGIRLPVLAEAHAQGYRSLPFMILASLMAISVAITSVLGVFMAFRHCDHRRNVWALLAFGTFVPAVLLAIAHWKR